MIPRRRMGLKKISQARAADPISCEGWMDSAELADIVSGVAFRIGVLTQDVPDLLQEVRIALWRLSPETLINRVWVAHTAAHKAVDWLRATAKRRAREEIFAFSFAGPVRSPDVPLLLNSRAAHLPSPLRGFYVLHYVLGLSEREISLRLGICRASVRWMDRRCKALLGALAATGVANAGR